MCPQGSDESFLLLANRWLSLEATGRIWRMHSTIPPNPSANYGVWISFLNEFCDFAEELFWHIFSVRFCDASAVTSFFLFNHRIVQLKWPRGYFFYFFGTKAVIWGEAAHGFFLCISTNFPERCSWDLCGSHHQKFSTSLSKLGHDWLALWIHSMSFWVLCPSDKVQLSPPTAPLIVVFTSPCGSASSKVTTALDELCKSSKSRRLFIQTWITIKWGIGVENYP